MSVNWSLLWLSLVAVAKCICSLQNIEKEEKICRLLEIRKPNSLLKKEIGSKLGGEELFWRHVKVRLISQAMMNQMFSCEVTCI